MTGGRSAVLRRTPAPRSLRALVVAVAVALLVGGLPWQPPTASADPTVGSAQARAKALAAQVKALQVQVEVATEQYDAVQEQLGEVVSRLLTASQDVGSLQQQADLLRAQKSARARALYMAGGQLGLYAQVLDGTDINDMIDRISAVGRVLDSETAAISAGDTAAARAQAQTDQLDVLAAQRTQLQAKAVDARGRVVALLAQASTQLDSANALVRRLVVEEQQRAAAAAQTMATAPFPPITLPDGTAPQIVQAIAAARTRLGAPYVWGATGPTTFDCSGLTQWAYAAAGVALPRTSREQWFVGPHPTVDELQPGDLLFWATDTADPATIHHVALYIGDGYMIEAPHTGAVVHVTPVYLDGFIGATRPVLPGG